MSDSVQPHRRQPTRLPRPWDSPGKNTGVGCHFLLQCVKVKSESEVAQLCPTLSNPIDCSLPGSSIHGIFQARALEWGGIAFSTKHTTLYKIDQNKDYYITGNSILISCNNLQWKIIWNIYIYNLYIYKTEKSLNPPLRLILRYVNYISIKLFFFFGCAVRPMKF